RRRRVPGIERRGFGYWIDTVRRPRLVRLLKHHRWSGWAMRFATDTGGTFTDLIIEDDDGCISMFKAATVPHQPVQGVLAAFEIAAAELKTDSRALLGRARAFV